MLFAIALLLQTATPPACATMDAALPAALAAWTTPGQGSPNDLTKPVVLMSMKPEDLAKLETTAPIRVVTIADAIARLKGASAQPAQTGGATRIGFRIDKAGTYGVALDQPGWIDLAPKGGAPLTSVAHGHGPECSTIRKIVRFDLTPGDYILTLTKLTKPQAKVMLVAS